MARIALITGVAGGIGSATAKVFSNAGWHVVGVDIKETAVIPGVARFICADIAQPNMVVKIIKDLSAQEARLDALVNNAAVQICKPLLDTSIDEWDLTMATNARAAFLLVLEAHPLLKQRTGAVVNICSVHAIATSVGLAAYASSKGALLALTRAMALELAQDNIRVNAILPGAVDTEMLRDGLKRGHACVEHGEDPIQVLGQKHPLGRVAHPEEIGRAALFLADPQQSSFMTGQALTVDGGALAKLSTE
jgi:NAD(P)-dependent dehydrogenase (short-subunit alcohol dehydrogenase family)